MDRALRQYALVTGSYWAFTLTDGALRMLVVLYFHQLGYAPLEVALLFVFYEFFGVVTNLGGGLLAARLGLNATMQIGLGLQIVALAMLLVDPAHLSVLYVMAAQALSGIAKDLNKMAAKSSIKLLVPEGREGQLYRWVALLTGSKNALKGVGFFLGAVLLATLGFRGAVGAMAAGLAVVFAAGLLLLDSHLGKTSFKPKFRDLLSGSGPVNRLSAARFFLFGARDVWFVVALPVFLQAELGWSFTAVGAFLACWILGYGAVQALAPRFTGRGRVPDGRSALVAGLALAAFPAAIALGLGQLDPGWVLVTGLFAFGVLFALNSAIHSYLIVSYARADGVALDVGFYYMANAGGRLLGTVLSGWVYQVAGLAACLWVSSALVVAACALSTRLPRRVLPARDGVR
ncbi:MAG: organoarsenical effux MFS transporter ArsJ [Gammaproteobacteria bacterium]|nr:organoarsenical effux MFS transporter ArsJ [Gammaproteobacteria bacterium]MBK9428354.1 organoarsenical effux MFS transporter ArsJ [Gammaproteobacteria bacterium]